MGSFGPFYGEQIDCGKLWPFLWEQINCGKLALFMVRFKYYMTTGTNRKKSGVASRYLGCGKSADVATVENFATVWGDDYTLCRAL